MPSLLSDRVKQLIESQSESLWFPTLTNDLVEAGEQQLFKSAGIFLADYGTTRVIAKNSAIPLNIGGHLFVPENKEHSGNGIQIEILERSFARKYEDADIRFYTAEEIASLNLLGYLKDTFSILKKVPTLFVSVTTLVRSLHLIKSENEDYDVSFSEPNLPFSIFISVPQASSINSKMRVLEAIVHEAMHLQLTLIEQIVPLVQLGDERYFSPWKSEYRSTQGVLHALYVFRVIHSFWSSLKLTSMFTRQETRYINNRYNQIAAEIKKIRSFSDCSTLTPYGSRLVRSLLANLRHDEE